MYDSVIEKWIFLLDCTWKEYKKLALVTAKCNSAVDCILPAQGVS